jgi:hypothetical protein
MKPFTAPNTHICSRKLSNNFLSTNLEWEWQTLGLDTAYGKLPSNDRKWHEVRVQRVGPHASLSLDGLVVALADNAPSWSDPLGASVLRLGKNFHGSIADLKVYSFVSSARATHFDAFTGDRDGSGAPEFPSAKGAPSTRTFFDPPPPPLMGEGIEPSLLSARQTKTFIPCLCKSHSRPL